MPNEDQTRARNDKGRQFGRTAVGRQPAGHQPADRLHSQMHLVAGQRVPVPRRELPADQPPQDETGHVPRETVQTAPDGQLPALQAADRASLLSRKVLPRNELRDPLLPEHLEETAGAAAQTADEAGAPDEAMHDDDAGRHAGRRGCGTVVGGDAAGRHAGWRRALWRRRPSWRRSRRRHDGTEWGRCAGGRLRDGATVRGV